MLSFCPIIINAAAAKSHQSCPTLCDPMACNLHQAPLSTGFSRQEYWSGLPFPSPGDLLDPGIKPISPALQADSLPFEPLGKLKTWDMTISHAPFSCNTYKYQKSSNLVVWERLIVKVE